MSATEITSRWASALLGGCRLAAEFLRENAGGFVSERLRDRAKVVFESIDGFGGNESATIPFDEFCALVLSAPGVESGFIQQTAALDHTNVVRVPGGAGAWIHGSVFRDTYRVFIHTGKAFAEASNSDLRAAVREAFERANLPLPKWL